MSNRPTKGRRALGKGLSALIPGADSEYGRAVQVEKEYFTCPIEQIHPQPDQPRQQVDKKALEGLVESIREQGIIQPLIVRRRVGKDGFELIAGERRWRASQLAGLKELPIVVKDASTKTAFEMALVENIQREDLNPIEESEAFERLIEEHGYTQAEVASRVGRDRSTVTNSLRLLSLPMQVKEMVVNRLLSEGHARAILQATGQARMIALAHAVASKHLSVRETERRARADSKKKKDKTTEALSPEVRSLTSRLQRALGARVKLIDKKGKGRIEISYTSLEELDRILNKILS